MRQIFQLIVEQRPIVIIGLCVPRCVRIQTQVVTGLGIRRSHLMYSIETPAESVLQKSRPIPRFPEIMSTYMHRALPLLLVLILLNPTGAGADQAQGYDVYRFMQTDRWDDLRAHFQRYRPRTRTEYYALAESIFRTNPPRRGSLSKDQAQGYAAFFQILGSNCQASSAAAFEACLEDIREESLDDFMQRLAIWKAAEYADKQGYVSLASSLQARANLSKNDPLSEKIFTDRLATYVQSGQFSAARALADRYEELQGPSANLYRARALVKSPGTTTDAGGNTVSDRDRALGLYFQAMRDTTVTWLERAIAQDVMRNYPGLFTTASLASNNPANREIVQLAEYMPAGELRALRRGITPPELVRTTTAERVRGDGLYLIAAGDEHSLISLANAAYTHLSHSPEILREWAYALRRKRENGVAYGLLTEFKHVRAQSPSLWQVYLDLVEERDRKLYFNELLEYNARYHAHFSTADRLIAMLIGESASNINWAPDELWNEARQKLPDQTGKGRFVYWLKRYYLHKNNTAGIEDLKENFYAMAPGSFYAGAFWEDFVEESKGGDFARDWQQVNDRRSYLQWVGRHGGNDQAVLFLRRRNLTRFHDPQALYLWKDFQSGRYRAPEDIQHLHRLGELTLGSEFFEHYYDGKVSHRERLARRAYLGDRANWLHHSVYFTRQLARDMGVPEDPFSMPEGLLKALYPRPYYDLVSKYSQDYNISSNAVYALMRQESMFREQAISRSGARGLMQIMPATGKWLAGKMNIRNPDLMEPDVNINMGAKFMSDLVRSTGNFRWASIAYNGGPGNLRRWKAAYYKDDFYFFLENLPKEEPRNYCRVTFQNYMHYKTTYALYPE